MTWLDDLEAKHKAATVGPWSIAHWHYQAPDAHGIGKFTGNGYEAFTEADEAAIVAFRNNADRLIGMLRESRELLAELATWEDIPDWDILITRTKAWLAKFGADDGS